MMRKNLLWSTFLSGGLRRNKIRHSLVAKRVVSDNRHYDYDLCMTNSNDRQQDLPELLFATEES